MTRGSAGPAVMASQQLAQLEEAEEVRRTHPSAACRSSPARPDRCAAPRARCALSAAGHVVLLVAVDLDRWCAVQHILRAMEHAGSVADLLADMDGERREEVLEGQCISPQCTSSSPVPSHAHAGAGGGGGVGAFCTICAGRSPLIGHRFAVLCTSLSGVQGCYGEYTACPRAVH
eukprot:COSAG02_NODE_742_length_17794_cov_22.222718_11_plen_175_part_00